MSSLVNLVVSFIVGLFFGHQPEEPLAYHEIQEQYVLLCEGPKSTCKLPEC